MRPADQEFDIVVSTNSGYPLDQNLYQTVKGMSAAARIVRPGGDIVMASACSDGIPHHGAFFEIVQQGHGMPEHVLDLITSPGYCRPDQWQAQILAMVCMHAQVYLYSDGVTDEQARQMMLEPTRDVSALLAQLALKHEQRTGRPASICVLPEGPQTIPYL
jgi:nickel-dependent lactate racemase